LAFTDRDLKNLLETSRRHNEACQITGLLLYVYGNFIQLLEGRKEDVLAMVDRIGEDTRHRGMIRLLEADCAKREFPDWSMGFESVSPMDADTMPGLSDFLRREPGPSVRQSSALKLLEFFREINSQNC
jgi:hypothetical protein